MKLLFFGSDYPPTGGGISTYTREWLVALSQEKGVEGKAVIFGNKQPRVEYVGTFQITTLKSVNFFYVGFCIFFQMWRRRDYDVFHSFNLFPVGFWVIFWAKVFGKKSVLNFYGADACDKRTTSKVLSLQKWAIAYATWAITISEFTRGKVVEKYGMSGKNIHVVYPIVPQKGKEEEKHKDEKNFTVLSVSRLVKRKGIEYLIEAISKIPDPSVKLIIIGGGPERENLENIAKNLGVSDRVTFTGKVPSLASYYSAADVSCLVSYIIEEEGDFEGLGLVLLEAQSYGVPVVGTKSGGIPEAFHDGKTGLLVSEKNSDEIAKAILRIKDKKFEDPREFLEERFGKENTVRKYIQLLWQK